MSAENKKIIDALVANLTSIESGIYLEASHFQDDME